MESRIIPEVEAAKLQVEIEKIFNLIATALSENKTALVITHLYTLHTFIQKNIQPYYGKGKLLPIAAPVHDFDIAGLIDFFEHEFKQAFEKKYDDTLIRNGAILLEALQTTLNNAAPKEDNLTITNVTLVKGMLKLFSYTTNSKFILTEIDFKKDIDPVVASLNLNAIIRSAQGNIFSLFYTPLEILQLGYQQYLTPLPTVVLSKFRM